MKTYVSIPHILSQDKRDNYSSLDFTAFEKLDGSNIRAEWSPKKGFYKFGSRRVLLDKETEHLGKAISLIQDTYASKLNEIFKEECWQNSVICFFEFYGPRSFAGNHHPEDEHCVTLFDVSPYKQGLLPPRQFIKLFKELTIPKVLYQGPITDEFVTSVISSTLPGIPLEGVVCKASNPNGKKTSQPIMFKLKTQKWLDMLREFVRYDEALFKRMM